MAQRSIMAIGSTLLVTSLSLAACGSRESSTTGSGDGDKVIKIGVIAPLSGKLSAMGIGMKNSADLAVKKANETKAIPGWTLKLEAVDDEAKPDTGKNAATKLAGMPDVAGVVGDLNSGVTLMTAPVFANAKIVQVSPASTKTDLTNTGGKRVIDSFFRTCTTDGVQGPFAAQYLLSSGIKKVVTVNDKKPYGQGLVTAFEAEFKKGGGEILASETIDPEKPEYSAVVSKIKPLNPQVVYYGGENPEGGPLSQQMKGGGLNIPLAGGDGLVDPKFIELAGPSSTGDLATSVGAPTDSTEAGKKFLADYAQAGYKDPASTYGGYSYDAANAIIEALKTSMKDAKDVKSAREATVKAMGSLSFEGVTGKVAFDQFGDAKTRVLTVYKVDGGKWVPVKTGEVK